MSDEGVWPAIYGTFSVLRAVHEHPGREETGVAFDQIDELLRELGERHGPRAVTTLVYSLATRTLHALPGCFADDETMEEFLEREELRALGHERPPG